SGCHQVRLATWRRSVPDDTLDSFGGANHDIVVGDRSVPVPEGLSNRWRVTRFFASQPGSSVAMLYMDVLALRRQGLTIAEIAEETGYHPATLAKWINVGGCRP